MKASTLADAIGRKKIAEALQVGTTAVSNAVVRKTFPPSWYYTLNQLAAQEGLDCPPELFGMKPSIESPTSEPSAEASL